MWMMILFCISPDCSGAMFTTDNPFTLLTTSIEQCTELGKDKAAIFHHWSHYDYAFRCLPVETSPGGASEPVLDYRDA